MRVEDLPTFEQIRVAARRHLSDARDWLHSDWREDGAPNAAQNAARREALRYIGLAKAALDDAARMADR